MELYAEIILPIAIPPLTFKVAEELCGEIAVGQGVEVQLGARKLCMGVVRTLHGNRPDYKTIKTIRRILRSEILVPPATMRLWEWMAEYYMCSLGEVMRAALPTALKPSALTEEAFEKEIFKLRSETFVRLNHEIDTPEKLNTLLEPMQRRAKARYGAVMSFCAAFDNEEEVFGGEVPMSLLTADGVKPETIRTLARNNIFTLEKRELPPDTTTTREYHLRPLSEAQNSVFEHIENEFATKPTVLLHGITGSGKTEIYAHLTARRLERGESVLILLPEIANLKQIGERLEEMFGNCVSVYSSKLSVRQRTETYLRMCHSKGGCIVVGVRSALFLPIPSLGLIIVDEEHDRSFKQDEPSPRYSARDSAVWWAVTHGINTLLGSATPSVESYFNAKTGKYGFARLTERYGNGALPRITISDTIRSAKRGERKAHANKELRDLIEAALANGRQTILYQNRRGFAPYIECPECGWTAHCPDCSVSMTLHKAENRLRCHHCGHVEAIPTKCPRCKRGTPETRGFGTEQIGEDFSSLYPHAVIEVLDADTATTAAKYERIIDDFEQGRTDILVGTQMITKSFDFPKVDVVGILNADNMLNYPDFRSEERTFQSIVQVAGRAGRKDSNGEVIVQTSQPVLPLFSQIASYNYEGMFRNQLAERKIFNYPPFGRLITVIMKHPNNELLSRCANTLVRRLSRRYGDMINGPYPPVVNRVRKVFIQEILVRMELGKAREMKQVVADEISAVHSKEPFKRVTIFCNVDPQ